VGEKVDVFISHIGDEAPLANVLKKWIEENFPDQVEVVVSSDPATCSTSCSPQCVCHVGRDQYCTRLPNELRVGSRRRRLPTGMCLGLTRRRKLLRHGLVFRQLAI